MNVRRWATAALVLTVVCIGSVLVAFRKDIAIAYHRRAMVRARAKIREVGPNGNQMPWIESFEHHRDALVRSGYLARREFPLSVRPPETNRLWRQLYAQLPAPVWAQMETTQWGGSENKIIVWDRPYRMPEWEAAIRRLDVPDEATSSKATVDSDTTSQPQRGGPQTTSTGVP